MSTTKIAVIFFSEQGHTERAAKLVQQQVGGQLVRLTRKTPYPVNYDDLVTEALRELEADTEPALSPVGLDLNTIDTIYLGYPTWNYQAPRPVQTFLATAPLAGKTVVPFMTSFSSTLADSRPGLVAAAKRNHLTLAPSFAANSQVEITRFFTGRQ